MCMSVTANNFATRYGSGDQEGAGFDTIGNHSMLTTAKTFYALRSLYPSQYARLANGHQRGLLHSHLPR
ncbi:Uncharacterised protein [Vibrio cholerae]|nr:Uncharacterised protein [Vibrio cholerae]